MPDYPPCESISRLIGFLGRLKKHMCMCVFAAGTLASPAALAQEGASIISEVKAGVVAHDIEFLGNSIEDGLDINAEVLFASPRVLDILFSPRPHVGVQINTQGDTSQIYAGFTWTYAPLNRLWFGFGAGGTVHNGETDTDNPGKKALGSNVLFRLSGEIGYDVTETLSVSIYYDHESNASLADKNEGLNNAGVRFGLKF